MCIDEIETAYELCLVNICPIVKQSIIVKHNKIINQSINQSIRTIHKALMFENFQLSELT